MDITPTLETVLGYTGDATHMAVSVELLVDTDTPISLFQKLAPHGQPAFLLESAEGGETFGRYSFIGLDPAKTFHFSRGHGVIHGTDQHAAEIELDDPLEILAELLAGYRVAADPHLPRFSGGAVGYLGYDNVRYFEKVPVPEARAPAERETSLDPSPGGAAGWPEGPGPREAAPLAVPDGCFLIAERIIAIDHLKHRVILIDHVPLSGDRTAAYGEAVLRMELLVHAIGRPAEPDPPFAPAAAGAPPGTRHVMDRETYEAAVREAKEAIAAGEIFQVVLSRRTTVDVVLPPFEVYRALRALNPSPYMFYFAFEDWALVGASPEVLVRVDRGEILLRPIAGTRPRGDTREADEALERELAADEKELAEHHMLLDLGRNDVGRVAAVGTVEVARPRHIERYSHVMHLVSDVRGRLAPGMNAFDVLRACFPAGTVSGAPKIRAMELIARLERSARGVYSGAVGYFDFGGNMDTCIAIRSMVCEPAAIHLQAGAGIVHDSVPEREWEECENKAKSGLAAIALAAARHAARPQTDVFIDDPIADEKTDETRVPPRPSELEA